MKNTHKKIYRNMKEVEIHIGNIIRKQLRDDGRSIKWLAEKLCYERANMYRLLNKPYIDTYILLSISRILEHDFFVYYSDIQKK
jgi:hypothetical protein